MPRSKKTTIQIATGDVAFLELRGGRSHRGGGELSRSAVLHRLINTLKTTARVRKTSFAASRPAAPAIPGTVPAPR